MDAPEGRQSVACEPIAELGRQWLAAHPGVSARRLAHDLAARVGEMGYRVSPNGIQPILGGWKRRTRGYVYRAMLEQLQNGAAATIPIEHVLGPIPGLADDAKLAS